MNGSPALSCSRVTSIYRPWACIEPLLSPHTLKAGAFEETLDPVPKPGCDSLAVDGLSKHRMVPLWQGCLARLALGLGHEISPAYV